MGGILDVNSLLSGEQSADGASDALKRRTGESVHDAIGPRGKSQPARSEVIAHQQSAHHSHDGAGDHIAGRIRTAGSNISAATRRSLARIGATGRGAELARTGAYETHLNLTDQAACPGIDKADAVRAIFTQPAFRRARNDHVGKDYEPDAPEPAGIDILQNSRIRVVEFRLDHFVDVHDRDVRPFSVLIEFEIVGGSVMVHDVGRPMILAEHDIGRIAEQPAVECARLHQRPAYDRVCRVVVLGLQGRLEVDRLDARVSADRDQYERVLCECDVRDEQESTRSLRSAPTLSTYSS